MSKYTNTQDIAAIPTEYNGNLFKSRLEARWAVFFDLMEIGYVYEPLCFEEEFDNCIVQYLPDFYFPELECWAEVKGTQNNLNADFDSKMRMTLDYCPSPIWETLGSEKGFLLLGELPVYDSDPYCSPCFTFIQHHKGLHVTKCNFFAQYKKLPSRLVKMQDVHPSRFLYDDEYPQLQHEWISFDGGLNGVPFMLGVVKSAFDSARKWNFDKENN